MDNYSTDKILDYTCIQAEFYAIYLFSFEKTSIHIDIILDFLCPELLAIFSIFEQCWVLPSENEYF